MEDDVERSIDQLDVLMRIAGCLTSHRRLQLVRDGQRRTLRYATARVQNAGAVPEWQEEEVVPFDVVSAPADLDNWVTRLIRRYGT